MSTMLHRLVVAALIAIPSMASGQVATINGPYLSGSPPTGFGAQGFKFNCNNAVPTSGQCWPLMQLYDGATTATVNSSDSGLTVHVANSNANGQATMANSSPVTIAGDQAAQASAGQGATGSAVPSGATYAAAISSGNLTGIIQADSSASISVSSTTTAQIIPLSSGKKTYITGFDIISGGTGTVQLEYGTGANCTTVVGTLTGAYPLTAYTGLVRTNGLGPALVVPPNDEVCVVTTASATAQGSISYTQF
jgi:hypothetical protein